MRRPRPAVLLVLAPLLLVPAARTQPGQAPGGLPGPAPGGAGPVVASRADLGTDGVRVVLPRLRIRRVATGLENPWDAQEIGGGRLLVTERDRARVSIVEDGVRRTAAELAGSVWVSGETGLMSIARDPRFERNGLVHLCYGSTTASGHDVRVVSYRLGRGRLRPVRVLLDGLPASSGRHGGCRLLVTRAGWLLVGTGDAAVGTNPRDLDSLGGKVLRLDPRTGAPAPGNPFADADGNRRYVLTYGHRNVQGLAQRRDGGLWSVEHGPDRDDEVNRLRSGGDYGWNPVPGYDESVPMTDQGLPGRQREAAWSSGIPTLAPSGAAWVDGPRWGRLDGTLAVAALKAERLLFLRFDDRGRLRWVRQPASMQRFGRLRSVTVAGNGDLLVTTSNGADDAVLRVSPR